MSDYLGLVCAGAAATQVEMALVIADEPLPAAYLPDIQCILQWQYAPSEHTLVSAARSAIAGPLVWQQGPFFEFRDQAVMFDAAASGESLDADEMLTLSLPPGRYQCLTAEYSDGGDIAGVLHQFRPVEDGAPG
ncbi:hypothetical protein SPAR_11117 [Streptomyces sparsogenes DSM 40356]|uniref:Uncharacterized protein n=1 Tax=Streptomyces sparsogenes DSM 40356 TaxID=1331668 RepID=A0A1R1SM20_9ACTN|nr:hypothetical protein SPAR_11117 [Streptomyces sparsogenes DSM 40356]